MADDDIIFSDDKIKITKSFIKTEYHKFEISEISKVILVPPDTKKADVITLTLCTAGLLGGLVFQWTIWLFIFFVAGIAFGFIARQQPHSLGVMARGVDTVQPLLGLHERRYLQQVMAAIEAARSLQSAGRAS